MRLVQATFSVFNQLAFFLDTISNEQFSMPLPLLHNNSIGKHVRHIIEFYECLLESKEYNVLDYDLRKRNLLLEMDKEECKRSMNLIEGILSGTKCETIIQLSFLAFPEDEKKLRISSNWDREIAYNIEHTIHHMAIIGMAMSVYFPDIKLGENFGVAPSTIKFIDIKVNDTIY